MELSRWKLSSIITLKRSFDLGPSRKPKKFFLRESTHIPLIFYRKVLFLLPKSGLTHPKYMVLTGLVVILTKS